MLTHLHIRHYAIVDQLDIEFANGLTAITGETGAGKSIMLGALGLCLGNRADPETVRGGQQRAEVSASFDISQLPAAQRWLQDRDLHASGECILRRVVTREGRSRAFINGNHCTLQDCAELSALLIDIHSQHAHQSLLRRDTQRGLLDDFANQGETARELERLAQQWLHQRRELDALNAADSERNARVQLLAYQVEELDALKLQPGELERLEADQQQLANAEQVLQTTQQALELCEAQQEGARAALQLLQGDAMTGKHIDTARELLDGVAIHWEEARLSLRAHAEQVEIDPDRLQEVERRLDGIYSIARKHRVQAPELAGLHERLGAELAGLTDSGKRAEELTAALDSLGEQYAAVAAKLSKARQQAAGKLQEAVAAQLAELAMAGCQLTVALRAREQSTPHPQGLEEVEFLVSTNPGQPPRALGKIASGGELSRISLAIQVVCAHANTVPSMVFDEVDAGIGGAVAEVVGRLLRALSARSQVLCVTHLAQVAAQGHQHLRVSKTADGTGLERLDNGQRVEEVARMLGGLNITDTTRAAAREMLG